MLWVTNSDRGRKQVELVHFPLPSPPLYLSFVGTATSSLSPNRWVLWNFSDLMLACCDFFIFIFVAVLFLLAELECSLFLVCWNCVLSCCCWVLEVVTEFLWNLCFGFEICAVVLKILWSFWLDLDPEVLDVIFGLLILFLDYDIVHTYYCFWEKFSICFFFLEFFLFIFFEFNI